MGIMNQIDGVTLEEKRGGKFRFRMHMTQAMSETPLESLELGARASNSLRRAGYATVGELANDIASGTSLYGLRNCGKNSVREIMEHLFLFQYNSLPPKKRNNYLLEVVMLNIISQKA